MENNIEKKDKLGEGAYGVIYQGEMKKEDKVVKVAVKRNFRDEEIFGIASLREMSFLNYFSHPCIVKLEQVSKGDPFNSKMPGGAMSPIPGGRRHDMTEDSHHFIMEFSEGDLSDYYMKCKDYYHLQVIMCQILLGMEFIHAKNVIHRDLKPDNVLVSIGEDGLPYSKIIDFGLTSHNTNYRPSTPGVVTYCYRAPEICCKYENYDTSSDMWSIGCMFYEIFKKEPLVLVDDSILENERKDESQETFKKLINYVDENLTTASLNEYIGNGRDKFRHNYRTKNKKNLVRMFKKSIDIEKFNNSGGGNLEDLIDIIKNLIVLNPEKRLTATECLDHKFFDILKEFNLDMRRRYPPVKFSEKKIKIINCLERAWAVNVLYKLYNNRPKWYNHHIIFHSLRVFDEYLVHMYKKSENLREKAQEGIGRLHTKHETEIYIYSCIYMAYKYYNVFYEIKTWNEIFPNYLAKEKNLEKISNFEKLYIENICEYQFYGDTLIEYLDEDYEDMSDIEKEIHIRKYLLNYTNIEIDYYEGNVEDFYLQIREGLKK